MRAMGDETELTTRKIEHQRKALQDLARARAGDTQSIKELFNEIAQFGLTKTEARLEDAEASLERRMEQRAQQNELVQKSQAKLNEEMQKFFVIEEALKKQQDAPTTIQFQGSGERSGAAVGAGRAAELVCEVVGEERVAHRDHRLVRVDAAGLVWEKRRRRRPKHSGGQRESGASERSGSSEWTTERTQ